MSLEFLILYTVFSFFYVVSPGPAVFLAISNGMTMGLKTVALSSLGNITGLMLLSLVSILGLGTIITTSATLFTIVKLVGAFYLVYLGLKHFLNSKAVVFDGLEPRANNQRMPSAYFHEAFLLAATNPKAVLFFTAIFPQFMDTQSPVLPQFIVLTAIFMLLSFISLFSYGALSRTSRHLLSNARRMAWFHRITGGLFIAIGLGLTQLKMTPTQGPALP